MDTTKQLSNMHNEEQQVYKWLVKRGSVLIFKDGDKIQLELDQEGSASCLLTKEDTEAIISILTSLAEIIWHNPDYIKEPYQGQLYNTDNDLVYWGLDETKLYIGFNVNEDALSISYSGDAVLKIPVNYAVELIQILTHYSKQFGS